MKKIIFVMILLIGSISSINAAEKKDCSGIKKLSKAFVACKSGNLKAGIVNTGSKIKKKTVGKIKKPKKTSSTEENNTNVKKKWGMTKQYPKGTK
tara:strand:+ start:333 stop:617 length:285 start_codon:yes stop_codon:yes gene_type:complete